jgi:hypothetical protein
VIIEYEDVQSAIDAYRVLTNECNHPSAARRAVLVEDESENELQLNLCHLCDSRPRSEFSCYKANCTVYSQCQIALSRSVVSKEVNNRITHMGVIILQRLGALRLADTLV